MTHSQEIKLYIVCYGMGYSSRVDIKILVYLIVIKKVRRMSEVVCSHETLICVHFSIVCRHRFRYPIVSPGFTEREW